MDRRFFATVISTLVTVPFLAAAQTADTRVRVVELFQQAAQAEQADDLPKAAGLYRSIVAIDSSIAEVWSNLGAALYREEQYKESIVAFTRAAGLKPSLLAPPLFTGMAYLKIGEAAKALAPLRSALAIEPEQAEAILALSEAYAQTRQFEASVRLLQKALKRDRNSESLGSNLAASYLEWAKEIGIALRRTPSVYGRLLSDRVYAANDPRSAESAFRDTVAFDPNSVEARLAFARFLLGAQPTAEKLQLSGEQIAAAKKISPRSLEVTAVEIQLAIAQQDVPRASALLHGLIREDPGYMLANLDTLTESLPAEVARQINDQVADLPVKAAGSPDSFSWRYAALKRLKAKRALNAAEGAQFASVAWHLHRYDEALSELVNRRRLDAESQYWLFRTCEALGNDVLKKTVSAHPDSLRSHLLLADFAIQQNNFNAARSEYEAALSLNPRDPDIRLLNVRLLETSKEDRRALQEAERGVIEFPSDAGLNFEAGELMLRSSGDAEGAAKYLERALKTDERLVRARTDLADAYAQLQKYDDAIREINQIADTDEDGTLHYRLARWYRQTGHPDEAATALELCKRIKEQKYRRDISNSSVGLGTDRAGKQ